MCFLMFLYPFVYLATNFEIIQFENVTVCQRDCNQSIIFCIRTQKMVKELRFLLDKPSGLWLQNGSTLWQFCTLGGVETKIDHLLFISSFDQWIDLQDAIIGFEKMRIWLSEKMSKICIWAYSILPHHLRIILALAYVASGL